jgi:SAM-dependent methyltransferase
MSVEEPTIDVARVEAFSGRVLAMLNGAMASLMLSVGHRTGLFEVFAGLDRPTASELAQAAGCDERYVREWLAALLMAGVVDHDPASGTYRLPPERAAILTRAAGPGNAAVFSQMVAMCGQVEDQIVRCFRHGGGVPYAAFPRFHDIVGEYSAAVFDASLIEVTLPLVPGIVDRLHAGIEVADVGAGRGHAANLMAAAFPRSRFTAIDIAADALAVGREEARQAGLRNVRFVVQDAAALPDDSRYDFVTTFDAVHDQVDPVAMVRGVHRSLEAGGVWLCVDIGASSHVHENVEHPMATFLYTLSCMHCMTVSLAHGGAGLGAMWGEQKARDLFAGAGFADLRMVTVPGDPFNSYYICRKAS